MAASDFKMMGIRVRLSKRLREDLLPVQKGMQRPKTLRRLYKMYTQAMKVHEKKIKRDGLQLLPKTMELAYVSIFFL